MNQPSPAAQGPIWLVGMMGAGKSTVARLLAARTGRRFFDLDRLLEEATGRTVTELFAAEGEAAFRAREAELALRLAGDDGAGSGPAAGAAVIATGGGTACSPATMRAMKESGLVVWLRADVDDVMSRIDLSRRPLLADTAEPRARWSEIAERRRFHYRAADLVVERRGRTSEQVAEELAEWLVDFGAGPLGYPPDGGAPVEELAVELPEQRYPVFCDPGADAAHRFASHLARLVPPGGRRLALATDETVATLHGPRYLAALQHRGFAATTVVVPAGEAAKSLAQLAAVAETLATAGLDRRSLIVGLGGGAVLDLAGFAAAILYRGVAWAAVPTTLLAQVDAAVGGKNGVNLEAGKNLVGTFHQPRLVYADLSTLATLPPRDLAAGLGEVAKHALLDGGSSLDRLLEVSAAARRGDPAVLAQLVAGSCRYKARIVAADERELDPGGGRALLNLGHTVGHAIETTSRRRGDPLRHGEAVALGLIAAARVGASLPDGEPDLPGRVIALLAGLGLPTDLAAHLDDETFAVVGVDKKRRGGAVRFVALLAPGRVRLVQLPPGELADLLRRPPRHRPSSATERSSP